MMHEPVNIRSGAIRKSKYELKEFFLHFLSINMEKNTKIMNRSATERIEMYKIH